MSTRVIKVIVIGEENKAPEQKKPIELIRSWCGENEVSLVNSLIIKNYDYIELIAKNYFDDFDLIFCYYDAKNRGEGCIFLGHWNDGVV